MKQEAFYQQAFEDVNFRRNEIENLRYGRNVILASCIIGAVLCLTAFLCIGLLKENWMVTITPGLLAVTYVLALLDGLSTRMAALKVIDEKCSGTHSPAPNDASPSSSSSLLSPGFAK